MSAGTCRVRVHRTAGMACEAVTTQLAFAIADEAACSDVEGCARRVTSGKHEWYDLNLKQVEVRHHGTLLRAIGYIHARGPDLTGQRMIRCQAFPNLVRFEEVA